MSSFSYFRGTKRKRKKNDTFTRCITIGFDESGTFSKRHGQSVYYTMVATVVTDYDQFEKITSHFPKKKKGIVKSSNVNPDVRGRIIKKIAGLDLKIYISSHDKSLMIVETSENQTAQYCHQVKELLVAVFSDHSGRQFDVIFDSNSLIKKEREDALVEMCHCVADEYGKEILWIEMESSKVNRFLQVIDFPTNVIGTSIEQKDMNHESHEERKILHEKIRK